MTAIDPASSASDLTLTNPDTVENIEDLDSTPAGDGEYTAEELEQEIDGLSDGNAEALVDTFDQSGDGKLDETEVEVMQEAIEAAVDDGKLKDGTLTLKDIEVYAKRAFALLEQRVTLNLFNLVDRLDPSPATLAKESAQRKVMQEKSYDVKHLMEVVPQLSKQEAQGLMELFDKDRDNKLNVTEVSHMKNVIERAVVDIKARNAEPISNLADLLPFMLPVAADDIQALLDVGGTYYFTYQNEPYMIIKSKDSGRYEAFDNEGNKVDPNVRLNGGSIPSESFIRVGGLAGMSAEKDTIISTEEDKSVAADQPEEDGGKLPPESHIMV